MPKSEANRAPGRERRTVRPFIEIVGTQYRWRRLCPADLRQILGLEAWVFLFPLSIKEETVDDLAQGLTEQTDRIISDKRKKLRAIQSHRERTNPKQAVPA